MMKRVRKLKLRTVTALMSQTHPRRPRREKEKRRRQENMAIMLRRSEPGPRHKSKTKLWRVIITKF